QMGKLSQRKNPSLWQRFVAYLRVLLGKILRFNILTGGQMLLTGQHGLRGDFPTEASVCQAVVAEGIEAIASALPFRIHGTMFKDLPLGEAPASNRFYELPVQPNMVLHVSSDWQNEADYLGAMSSKYRVRARRARKKGDELERREMGLDEITLRQAEMFAFYVGIAEQSDFNIAILPPDYFTQWKAHFPERFRVWGYFIDGAFIGFSTTIANGPELEAHFLGFDQSYNRSHQLYLNMLYDMAEDAIAADYQQLVYSRTALEIKSSVGAVPEELKCWLHSRIRVADPLVPIVERFIAPLPEWVQRNPFK
ncbi:MAG: GNAT family N-acetyltransferase, partial [Bacteroidota bacterium]